MAEGLSRGRPPEVVVVGAMKCGTSALHRYLDRHRDITMSRTKELNFFFGPERAPTTDPSTWWRQGQWHRGLEWYLACFDPGAPVRGESSPGYTDPAHPDVAPRMAALVPQVRLLYLVRDPVDRAVSQWQHHRRDGTETRPVEEAVLDPRSQYLDRSRYYARIAPFLRCFARAQLLVVSQERLVRQRRQTLREVFAHVGVDPEYWHDGLDDGPRTVERPAVPSRLRRRVWAEVGADAQLLAGLI